MERFKIINFEHAVGKNSNAPYAKVGLEDSNNMTLKATAFDKSIIEALSKNQGQLMELQVEESEKDGRTYHNIRGFAEVEVMGGSPTPKKTLLKTDEQIKKENPIFNPTTMYVSYAKDIFIEMYTQDCAPANVMEAAIELVKQATKEFS